MQFEIVKNPGIDFYSGFRNKIQVYTVIVASEKKNTRGGVQFEILKNPGIDFYSGFRKTSQGGGDITACTSLDQFKSKLRCYEKSGYCIMSTY